ncbi:response regulator transcription factor [Candidatus Sulfurimonas baltica]|uniref:Response regulator transcription factor n=1 Tax=Candidatus Sulfurimonas baltica TaxID=2740404 RepID=A0A7S7LW13_9BACT|nr:response regulator [Candidatus Sulfurimonas baltica]QOY52401.1 response regulator transcription factor [Candidatus Sulfurimonas baltica]
MDNLSGLNLLFLESNEEFAKNITEFLNIYFRQVFHSSSIKNALSILADNKIDVIITDVKLSDGSGLEFIQNIRRNGNNVHIVILSAFKNEEILLQAIPLNLLSYEIKPISYDNFMSLLEKISHVFEPKGIVCLSSKIKYDTRKKEFILHDKTIALTKKEILFIELLLKNNTEIVTHEMIQINVWQNKQMSDSAIKNLVLRLRKKIDAEFLTNIAGVGYKLSHSL